MEQFGWAERWARNHPRVLEVLSRWSINGTGLSWIDFHDRRSDGTLLATQWLRVAFLPIAPLRSARLLRSSENTLGVPGLLSIHKRAYEMQEEPRVVRGRLARVYGFYYGVFFPMALLPAFLGFAWMVATDFQFGPLAFWSGVAACLAVGISAVALERRWMGPPDC